MGRLIYSRLMSGKRSYHYTITRTGRRSSRQCIVSLREFAVMPEYQHLTEDELLNIAEDREHLTDEARMALDTEFSRRKLSSANVDSHRLQKERANKAD